jgi:lysozyme
MPIENQSGPSPAARKTAIVAAVVAVLGPAEGMRRVAYFDPPGILTVCEGHTDAEGGPKIDPHHVYTIAECKAYTQGDAGHAVDLVLACTPANIPDGVAVAFSDAVFNLGPTVACDRRPPPNGSTAARLLYAHDWKGACEQLPLWNKARITGILVTLPGLTTRRLVERDICLRDALAPAA